LKLFTYAGFWVPASFWAVLYVFCLFISTQININFPGLDSKTFFIFPNLWNTTTWLASWFNLLLAIMIMIFICNEFSFRTFRQHVIDGLSRNELFLAKVALMLVFAVAGVAFVIILTFVTGLFFNTSETWSQLFDTLYLPVVYFVQAFAYMSLAMMISLLLKNTAISIITFILYFFPIEPIIRNFFPDKILFFFPMKVISNLTPAPDVFHISTQTQFYTTINGQVTNSEPAVVPFNIPLWENTLVALGYIAIFLTISWYVLKKKKL